MKLYVRKLPYPLSGFIAYIRRRRNARWMRRWNQYAAQNNVKPTHD